jgi:hypothetical protein
MFVKYMSALLVVWYSLSVIGFDVHSCKSTGEVFVASLAGGIACEDVHPDHSCKAHGSCCGQKVSACCSHDEHPCCGHEDHQTGSQVSRPDCCSNDLQVLLLTGMNVSHERDTDGAYMDEYVLDVDLFAEMTIPAVQRPLITFLKHPDPGVVMPDRQACFSIWRV